MLKHANLEERIDIISIYFDRFIEERKKWLEKQEKELECKSI